MSDYRILQELCMNLEEELLRQNSTLFSANAENTADEIIEKKLRDLCSFSSKNCLLRAKREAATPQIEQRVVNNLPILRDLETSVENRIVEKSLAKCFGQSAAVKILLTTLEEEQDYETSDRIITIKELSEQTISAETTLKELDVYLREKETENLSMQKMWNEALDELKHKIQRPKHNTLDTQDPHYIKLNEIVQKMQIIRRMIAQLSISRTNYDWIDDPKQIFPLLKLTQGELTVQSFMESNAICDPPSKLKKQS